MSNQRLFLPTDPSQLGEIFTENGLGSDMKIAEWSLESWCRFRYALGLIPRRELDMLCAHLVWRKGQEEIARTFQVTQGDVSYRIKRAKERILLWILIDSTIKEYDLRNFLYNTLGVPIETVDVVTGIYRTTSQSVTAKTLQLTQGNVRHDFVDVRNRTQEWSEKDPTNLMAVKALSVLNLLSRSYNRLRNLDTQSRWKYKF